MFCVLSRRSVRIVVARIADLCRFLWPADRRVSSPTPRAVLAGMKAVGRPNVEVGDRPGQMSVALGLQSPRQFVRYGPGAAVVVDEEPADAASQRAVRGAVRSGRRSPASPRPPTCLLRHAGFTPRDRCLADSGNETPTARSPRCSVRVSRRGVGRARRGSPLQRPGRAGSVRGVPLCPLVGLSPFRRREERPHG
jgi:hypothetical protein